MFATTSRHILTAARDVYCMFQGLKCTCGPGGQVVQIMQVNPYPEFKKYSNIA